MSSFIILTIAFVITSSITTFDKRLIQARRDGTLLPDEPLLSSWVGLIGWIHWGLALALLIINWKYAIIVFIVMFVLAVLPVLETIGNILMNPFKQRTQSK
jgi:hypothetical protein